MFKLKAFVSLSPLKGNSPVMRNVCEADKRVPVHGVKDVATSCCDRGVLGGIKPKGHGLLARVPKYQFLKLSLLFIATASIAAPMHFITSITIKGIDTLINAPLISNPL